MVEVEAKLLVPDEATFAALGHIERIGPYRLQHRLSRLQQDTYLDTDRLRLFRAGYACRLRHMGHRAFAQVKRTRNVSGGIHAFEEIDLEIDNPSIGALLRLGDAPGPLVRRLAAGERLVRLFTVVTWRRLWVAADGCRAAFEMALDRARFYTPAGEHELLEVELESQDGDRGLLAAAAYELRRRYRLTESGLTKFERGLRRAGWNVERGVRMAD